MKRLIDAGGRLSRAAVFAGAAACYTNTPAPQQQITPPPPPPPDATAQTTEQQFAQPPDDAALATAAANGAIEGTVLAANKQPVNGLWLTLRGPSGGEQRMQTDVKGHYRFADLPPGNYEIEMPWNGNPRAAPPPYFVQVAAGQTTQRNLAVYTPPVDRGPCCKPYGAPPARRRVV